jgi:hypothetical protein
VWWRKDKEGLLFLKKKAGRPRSKKLFNLGPGLKKRVLAKEFEEITP